jgi:hypothetical protein
MKLQIALNQSKYIILPRLKKLLYSPTKDQAWPSHQDYHLTRFPIVGEYLVMMNPNQKK